MTDIVATMSIVIGVLFWWLGRRTRAQAAVYAGSSSSSLST